MSALIVSLSTAVGLASTALAWLRWVRPRLRSATAEVIGVRDSILGRAPIVDTITGREITPALPGIGVRIDESERQLRVLADAVAKIADSHVQLQNHEERLKALETAAVERVVSRAESTAAWRAMEAAHLAPNSYTDIEEDE